MNRAAPIPLIADPWRLQIAMLPMRRRDPDAARDEQARAKREVALHGRIAEMQHVAALNRGRVLQLFRGRLELKATQVTARTRLCTETARVILNTLTDQGDLTKRREKNTDWFRLATGENKNA